MEQNLLNVHPEIEPLKAEKDVEIHIPDAVRSKPKVNAYQVSF